MANDVLAASGAWPWIAVATWSASALWVGFFVVVRRPRTAYLNAGSILVLVIASLTTYRQWGWAAVALIPPGSVLMAVLVALYLKARGRPWRQ